MEQTACSLSPDRIPVEHLTHLNYAFAWKVVSALKTDCLSADPNSIDSMTLEIIIPGEDTPFRRKTEVINLESRNPSQPGSCHGWTIYYIDDRNTLPCIIRLSYHLRPNGGGRTIRMLRTMSVSHSIFLPALIISMRLSNWLKSICALLENITWVGILNKLHN